MINITRITWFKLPSANSIWNNIAKNLYGLKGFLKKKIYKESAQL